MQRHKFAFALCFGLASMLLSTAASAQYTLTNLDSNQVGWAKHVDPLQVNGWGLARSANSPFWVSDQGTGWSTIYNGSGIKQGLEVLVPSAGAGPGSPTGIVFNGSTGDFQVENWQAFFIFATLDGTISGWAPQSNPNAAIIAVNHSADGNSYTALAITNKATGNFLYAVDNAHSKVEIYDAHFNFVKSFTDTTLPAGFAPFGIQDINGLLYVTFAAVYGTPGGYIDVFSEGGTLVRQLVQGAPLNQPWGLAVAPSNFGKLSNTLLVSNNTNAGTINGFNLSDGKYVGTVRDATGKNIFIDQLWGIEFGGGTSKNGQSNQLFFASGPHGNLTGTFGMISLSQ